MQPGQGNPFPQAFRGAPLNIPAAAWNVLMRMARDYNGAMTMGSTPGVSPFSGTIDILNSSGADRGRGDVLGLDGVAIDMTANADAFKSRPVPAGVVPTAAHAGRFVVCAEAIPQNAIGRAYLYGIAAVQVNIVTAGDPYADVTVGDATQLTSGGSGAAEILWAESGTGTKWALVRLGREGGPWLLQISGNAGRYGVYTSRTITPASGDFDATTASAFAMADIGTVPTTDDSYYINLSEIGASTHDLTNAANVGATAQNIFVAYLLKTNSDGKKVYIGNGFWIGCST